jgi:hypothetical protein
VKTGRPDLDAMLKASSIPAGEPTFILRGQDAVGGEAVRAWAALAKAAGAPDAVLEQALQQADALDAWRPKKVPDAGHLTEAEQQNLGYQFGRRAWRAREAARPIAAGFAEGLVLAERRGADSIQPRVRELERELAAETTERRSLAAQVEALRAELDQLTAAPADV